MSFLTKGGQLVTQGGKLVTTSEPANCKCCKPLFCEFPYNVTVSTSITNVRLDASLQAAAGGKAGEITRRLEEILALNPPTFTRWCCLPEPTGCSLGDDIDGGLSDFDGVPQEASTIISGSGANLDGGISVSTSGYFFSGYHTISGFQGAPEGEAGPTELQITSFSFPGGCAPTPKPMTLRNICDGTKSYTFACSNRGVGNLRINYRVWAEDPDDPGGGNFGWYIGAAVGLFFGDTTYTVKWDYGGPPNQRKKLIEEESPLP